MLKEIDEFKDGSNLIEGLRKSFLKVDESLVNGGLDEVAQMRKDNPPTKSPLMKLLTDVTNRKA